MERVVVTVPLTRTAEVGVPEMRPEVALRVRPGGRAEMAYWVTAGKFAEASEKLNA